MGCASGAKSAKYDGLVFTIAVVSVPQELSDFCTSQYFDVNIVLPARRYGSTALAVGMSVHLCVCVHACYQPVLYQNG